MSKSKQMFAEMCEQEIADQHLDDEYEWTSRERVSSKTQSSIILNQLFSTFGEIFSASESLKSKMK